MPERKQRPAAKTAPAKTAPAKTPPAKRPAAKASGWSSAELDEVRAELQRELARIETELASSEATISVVMREGADGAGDDQADTGTKTFEREQELALFSHAQEAYRQTAHALERLADGSYGRCESCGDPIGKARLQAFPRATLCVACKQHEERH